jgi:multidrug efflux pump subunit AcrA (membrane-fusion protein)
VAERPGAESNEPTTTMGPVDAGAGGAMPTPRRWGRWRRRRVVTGLVVAALVAGGIAAAGELSGGQPASTAGSGTGTGTATVVLTDLAQTTPVNGTVGFASGYSIVQPSGNPSATLTKDQQAVSGAQQSMAADQTSMADTSAADQESVAQANDALQNAQSTLAADQAALQADQATLSADQEKESNDCQGSASAGGSGSNGSQAGSGSGGSSSPCSTDQDKVGSDQEKVDQDQATVTKDEQSVQTAQAQLSSAQHKVAEDADQANSKLAADRSQLSDAQTTLSTDATAATSYDPDSKYTALPAVGQVISPGQSVWSIDGRPVPLLPGVLTPWRAFRPGMSPGPDVAALNQALVSLGYGSGLGVSDEFGPATSAAIERLQGAFGLSPTGILELGAVAFSPTPVRVTAVHPLVGQNVGGGTPVLDVTSTTPVINVALPVNQSYLVKVGDAVTANLPDGTTAPGTITAVGTVATSTSSGSAGNNQPSATVNVTVALSHPTPAASLDQAPVTVNITNQSVDDVLAVPTTALLALAGGGYALEVVGPDATHHLVAVTTGIFDDQKGLVQVSGSGLAAGDKVVVPSS